MLPAMFAQYFAGAQPQTAPGKDQPESKCPNAKIRFQPAPNFARIAVISFWFLNNVHTAPKTSPRRQKFCSRCGHPADEKPEIKFCPNCGNENLDDAIFCNDCGEKLG